MADKKSVISQLQSVGEDALGKVAGSDAARSALQSALQLKDRAARSLPSFDAIEKRLDGIEKRLAALEGSAKKTTASSSSTRKTTASSKSSASKEKAASS